ncbi:MAG: TonB-dependent receptor plug domain-containing protein, partial [Rhodospirillaceae bacterium]
MRIEQNFTGVLLAGAMAITATPTLADDQSTPMPSTTLSDTRFALPAIDVTAPEPAPESERRLLNYPTTGLTRDQFETTPNQRLGDVLQRLPGVTMGGAPGERKDVRLRGMDKEYTRTQFDG